MAFDAVRDLLEHLRQRRVDVDVARNLTGGEVEALRQGDLRQQFGDVRTNDCLLYTSPSPRD